VLAWREASLIPAIIARPPLIRRHRATGFPPFEMPVRSAAVETPDDGAREQAKKRECGAQSIGKRHDDFPSNGSLGLSGIVKRRNGARKRGTDTYRYSAIRANKPTCASSTNTDQNVGLRRYGDRDRHSLC
jgi:hypothetical protein